MSLPAGHNIALSPGRRIMNDLMHVSRKVPTVSIERRMKLADLLECRARLPVRPSWFAIFLKAYALVAEKRAVLRQSYLSFPWARLHQHPCNVAQIAIARRVGAEEVVLPFRIRYPEKKSLAEIDHRIRCARNEPVENFGDFRQVLTLARFPSIIRKMVWWLILNLSGNWRIHYCGNYGLTGVAALGAASLNLLSPLTTTLTYGVFEDDGSVLVRLFFDHRVMDGIDPTMALVELEEVLNGPIRAELSELTPGASPCPASSTSKSMPTTPNAA